MQRERLGLALGVMGLALAMTAPAEANGIGLGVCYLRGDAGHAWNGSDDAGADASTNVGGVITVGSVDDVDFDDGWFGEIGVGCGLVRSETLGSIKDGPVEETRPSGLRGDITVGFRGERDFRGFPKTPPAVVDPVRTSLQTNTLMFNAYYDFHAAGGFTPYIGAGIGAAFHNLDDAVFSNGIVVTVPGEDETDFAWALMAGVAFPVGHSLLVDIGYRYIDLGEISVSNGAGFALSLDELQQHELRFGVRVPLSR